MDGGPQADCGQRKHPAAAADIQEPLPIKALGFQHALQGPLCDRNSLVIHHRQVSAPIPAESKSVAGRDLLAVLHSLIPGTGLNTMIDWQCRHGLNRFSLKVLDRASLLSESR